MLALFLLVGAAATASAQDELACFWVRATFPRGVRGRGVFFVLGKKKGRLTHTRLSLLSAFCSKRGGEGGTADDDASGYPPF